MERNFRYIALDGGIAFRIYRKSQPTPGEGIPRNLDSISNSILQWFCSLEEKKRMFYVTPAAAVLLLHAICYHHQNSRKTPLDWTKNALCHREVETDPIVTL